MFNFTKILAKAKKKLAVKGFKLFSRASPNLANRHRQLVFFSSSSFFFIQVPNPISKRILGTLAFALLHVVHDITYLSILSLGFVLDEECSPMLPCLIAFASLFPRTV